MSKYRASKHSTYNVGYHIVFCTKYRYNLLRYRAVERLKTLLKQGATKLGISIQSLEVMPNHVHLFILARSAVPIPQLICRLKGYTSYLMRKEFAYLRRYPILWTRSLLCGDRRTYIGKDRGELYRTSKDKFQRPFISRLKPGRILGRIS